METIEGSIAVGPYRAGKPLDELFDGFYSARRGTSRTAYRIDPHRPRHLNAARHVWLSVTGRPGPASAGGVVIESGDDHATRRPRHG